MGISFLFPKPANAVLPPDFIFNVGIQISQFLSIAVLLLTTSFGMGYRYWKALRYRWLILIGVTILILGGGGTIIYYYNLNLQNIAYQKWLTESQINEEIPTPTKVTGIIEKLNIPKNVEEVTAEWFVKRYYGYINDKKLVEAYGLSKKSVSFDIFQSWYIDTKSVTVDKIILIDPSRVSLELTLTNNNGEVTRYGVLMSLKLENNRPVAVLNSEVREIKTVINYDDNKTFVTNEEFKQLSIDKNSFLVLDAREDLEYENGRYPNGLHIRFADLKAGRWIELPTDKNIYVFCWSGIRGKEVTEFLRTKNIRAYYIENGANGWYNFGGLWQGDIKFSSKYTDKKFQQAYSTVEVKKMILEGIKLVDCREPEKFNLSHIENSVNIPIMYTPSIKLEETFAQVPKNSRVVTVCDGYVNCFDAKITGVELEKRGYTFLGRYTTPWEYEQ